MKTLFLDRDGVVNRRLMEDYVKNLAEFEILPGTLEAIALLKKAGYYIVLVTNQQGIGKGLMTKEELSAIHGFLLSEVRKAGGNIDAIQYCPHLKSDNCPCRKPKTGMIDNALRTYPEIDLKQSILIGDTESDITLAKNAGIKSILISEKIDFGADYAFKDLLSAANFLAGKK